MAITAYRIEDGLEASVDNEQNRSYVVKYLIDTNSLHSPGYIRNQLLSLLGGIGAPYVLDIANIEYEEDLNSFLQSVDVSMSADDARTWQAVCTYNANTDLTTDNPFTEAYDIRWENNTNPVPAGADAKGDPILNTAGEPFQEQVPVDSTVTRLLVERWEPSYDIDLALAVGNKVNMYEWNGFGSGLVKADTPSCSYQNSASGILPRVSYSFNIKPQGWDALIFNQGCRYLTASGDLKPILMAGAPVQTPVPLDEDGAVMSDDGTPLFVRYELYKRIDFAVFNLDGINFPEF